MINNNEIEKLKNEYPDIFNQFSIDFWKFIFSEETSSEIALICLENGIEDEEKIEKITYQIILILLNQIPKENLISILEKEIEIDVETAKKIYYEIEEFIFSKIPKIEEEESPTDPSSIFPKNEEKIEEHEHIKDSKISENSEKKPIIEQDQEKESIPREELIDDQREIKEKFEQHENDSIEEDESSFLDEETIKIREKYRKKPIIEEVVKKKEPKKEIKKDKLGKSSKSDSYRESIE